MEEALQLETETRFRVLRSSSVLVLFLLLEISIASSSASSSLSYVDHCNSIVPESAPTGVEIFFSDFLKLQNAYYVGGSRILDQSSQSSYLPRSLVFFTRQFRETDKEGVFKVEGMLVFRGANMYPILRNLTSPQSRHSRFRNRRPRFPVRRGRFSFDLVGFWSESVGKLCMVGSGTGYSKEGNLLHLSAVFKVNYPKNSTIFTSLVSGTLESLDTADSSNYFDPISILAFSQRSYNYTLISKGDEVGCSSKDGDQENLSTGLNHGGNLCSTLVGSGNGFQLEYSSHCESAKNCSPFGESVGFWPDFMSFSGVQCSENRRLRLLMGFSNSSNFGYYKPLVPNTTLIGEGVWDGEKKQLCLVACHILNSADSLAKSYIGDCSIRMTLRFPAMLSIKSRSNVVGKIWSNKTESDLGYFDKIMFRSSAERMLGVPGLRYNYTEIGRVKKLCASEKAIGNKEKMYPSVYSYDMRFDMKIKNSKGNHAWGYSVPVSVGDQFYEQSYAVVQDALAPVSEVHKNGSYSRFLNVSYTISFTPTADFEFGGRLSSPNTSSSLNTPVKIFAEGVYDSESGSLCMVGCRHLAPNLRISMQNDSLDCEILINFQFPPLNAKKKAYVKGTIESTRKKSDHLYFERLELSSISMSTTVAAESIWRMDLEITMVLISNTFICICVGLQLYHVKKHPDVLPFISLMMLVILTLGSMIPLVLNFEALFLTSRSRQNVLTGSGGWLEVNEVIVRVVTMVTFLLQFRLLQLTWSSRLGDGNQKGVWTVEKKALYVLLPLYLLGGLIAWIVLSWNSYYEGSLPDGVNVAVNQSHSLWGDLRSYAGLILDGFLLPQIVLNVFWSSKDKILSPAFYVGITAVRLLPHAYDLYRAHSYASYYDASYIYASPGGDFFSTAWDVIIPCGGLLFAILIYVQQRFGGRSILPRSFREFAMYEKVPVTSGE